MQPEFQTIQKLVSTGRSREALPLARRFTSEHPNDPQGWFISAIVSSMLGRMDEVIAGFRKVTELDPKRFDAFNNLGAALQDHGKLEEAVECYRRAIALKPSFAPAHANLGMVLLKLGKLDEAEAASRKAMRLDPNQSQTSNNLGLVLQAMNRHDEAAAVFGDVARRAPNIPGVRFNLALSLKALNRTDEACTQLEQAIRLNPDYTEALAELGLMAITEKRFPDAIASLERACRLNPNDPRWWMRLAQAYWMEKKYPDVIRAVEHAVKLNPRLAEAHEILGSAHIEAMKGFIDANQEAEKHYRRALEIKPDFLEARLNLASTLRVQGKYEEALQSYRAALTLAPANSDAVGGAASMLEHLDRIDEARQVLAPAIEKGIDSLALTLPYAAVSRYTGEKQKAVELLETMLADESGSRALRREGHFMLGKLHDSDKNYDQAFRHYRAANELDTAKFDIEGNGRVFQSLTEHFGKTTHHRRPRASNRSRLPVFIVGMPRSGTTLTEQILASHPRVHGAGELPDISKIKRGLPERTGTPWPECLERLDQNLLDEIAQQHLDRLARLGPGMERVTDKMPHNFQSLGLIDLLFPEARIIHCRRDPMDNCLSIYFQNFNQAHAYSNNLEHLGQYYRQYQRLMEHWRSVLRVPMLDLVYEETVAEPEKTARRLIEFVGLDWDDRCLRFYESERVVATPSYDQVRQPIYHKSVQRWKRYETHLEPLKRSLGYEETREPAAAK